MTPVLASALDAGASREALAALLLRARLPTDDLDDVPLEAFRVALDDEALVGCAAVQRHGHAGLLRSVAVAPEARGQGLGRRLVTSAETAAAAEGLHALYLLTTTARPFFESLGYRAVARGDAPAAILASRQAASLCPASAALLARSLAPRAL